jgi:outer membrane protein
LWRGDGEGEQGDIKKRSECGMIIKRVIFCGLVVSVLLGSTLVDSVKAAGSAAKVGYLDISKVFDAYEGTKASDKKLEEKKTEWQGKLDKIKKELDKLNDDLTVLSESAREKKRQQIEEKTIEFKERKKEAENDVKREGDQMVRGILREIETAVKDYGQKEGYALILNNKNVIYAADEYDITEKIISLLNSKYKGR